MSAYHQVGIVITHGRDSRPRLNLDVSRTQKTRADLDNGYLCYIQNIDKGYLHISIYNIEESSYDFAYYRGHI